MLSFRCRSRSRQYRLRTWSAISATPNLDSKGASPGPGGCTYGHLKSLIDDEELVGLLFAAATSLAQAQILLAISEALMGARLTALTKPDGGQTRRRSQMHRNGQHSSEIGRSYLAATDADPEATVLSVDCIGAYDHVLRAAMLDRLMQMPQARAFLPFVRLSYGRPSQLTWQDDSGQDRTLVQAEGGEQGDLHHSLGHSHWFSSARRSDRIPRVPDLQFPRQIMVQPLSQQNIADIASQ